MERCLTGTSSAIADEPNFAISSNGGSKICLMGRLCPVLRFIRVNCTTMPLNDSSDHGKATLVSLGDPSCDGSVLQIRQVSRLRAGRRSAWAAPLLHERSTPVALPQCDTSPPRNY